MLISVRVAHVKRVNFIYQLIAFFISAQASKRHKNMNTKCQSYFYGVLGD